MVKIIAFGHKKRVGKDTAGKFLTTFLRLRNIPVRQASFALKMKDIAHQMYAWAGMREATYYEDYPEARDIVLPHIGKTPRQLHIDVGMAGRSIYENTWVDLVLQSEPGTLLCITDLRFPNEAERIHELGGLCIKINNDRIPRTDDVADCALDNWNGWDLILDNNGTLNDFNTTIITMLEGIGYGK